MARVAAVALVLSLALAGSASAAGPPYKQAQRFAKRTYSAGSGSYRVIGPPVGVRAADGSRIYAFQVVRNFTADGKGQTVLLFRGKRFLGWIGAYEQIALTLLGTSNRAIVVRHLVYDRDDALCCPSRFQRIGYRWNGRRIVAGAAPRGRQGPLLRLRG